MNLHTSTTNVIRLPRRIHTLNPGEWTVGHAPAMIETLLGSCVSIALWCGDHRIGGLCHYVLPSGPGKILDPRYGDAALALMIRRLRGEGIDPTDCVAKLFGGGKMFSFDSELGDVGTKNVDAARTMLAAAGIPTVAADVGGWIYRKISFDLETGSVAVSSGNSNDNASCS